MHSMRLDFLIADNPYGTTFHFAKSLSEALHRLGVTTRLIWVGEDQFYRAFEAIEESLPDCTCSFSDIRPLGSVPLGELWRIPHLSFLIDPAIYFEHHFQRDYSWVTTVDEAESKWIQERGFSRAFFMPHGGDPAVFAPVDQERPFEHVFFGTCIDYQELENSWKKKYSQKQVWLLKEACESVLSPRGISILEALVELGIGPEDYLEYHKEVDQYTRGKDRVELLQALAQYSVHVWGCGPWEKYAPRAEVHPPLPFEKTLSIMQRAKYVLNSSPRFKRGSHERIFYGQICGACVITGSTSFTAKLPSASLITYHFGEWGHSLEKIKAIPYQQVAACGQQHALTEHTWDARAKTVHSILNFLKK